jgi:hypothetical protein
LAVRPNRFGRLAEHRATGRSRARKPVPVLSRRGSPMAVAQRKRPMYLVFALLGALALGVTGSYRGCDEVTLYRTPVDASLLTQGIADEAYRALVAARFQAYLQAFDAAKARGFPLAVAGLLLGAALVFAAMRALGGNGARSALVQLVIAQAGVNAASYWLLRDVSEAELRLDEARWTVASHQHIPDRRQADDEVRKGARVLRAAHPITLAMRTLGSALVVVALTRRRTRALLDAPTEAVKDP